MFEVDVDDGKTVGANLLDDGIFSEESEKL